MPASLSAAASTASARLASPSPRPSVVRVRTTITSPIEIPYTLGPKTLVVGGEGAGKTRLLHALQLALTGKTSDLLGRGLEDEPAADPGLLATLGVPGTDLYSIVTFEDGTEAVWAREWAKGGWGKAQSASPPFVDPMRALPVRNARSALRADPVKAATFFLGSGGVTREMVMAALPPQARAAVEALFTEPDVAEPPTPALILPRVVAVADRRKLDLHAAAREAEKAAERAAPPLVTEAQVAAAEAAASGGVPGESAEHRLWRLGQLWDLVEAFDEVRILAIAAIHPAADAKARAEVADWPESPEDFRTAQVLRKVADVIGEILPALGDGFCPLCATDTPDGHLEARKETLRARAAEMEKGHAKYRAALEARQAKIDEATAASRAAVAAAEAAGADYAAKHAEYAQLWDQIVMTGIDPALAEIPDVEPLEALPDIVALSRRAAELRRQHQEYARWQAAGEDAKELRRQAEEWKALAEAAERAQRQLAQRRVTEFAPRVNPYLDDGEALEILFQWAGRETFLPALRGRDGDAALRPALSGMESQRMLFALSAAILPPPPNYALLLPDDRDKTPARLRWWMERLEALDAQVVLTAATPPEQVGGEWTVLPL